MRLACQQIFSHLNLNQDLINNHILVNIENASPKTSFGYSILVKQYALTKDAFDFWTVIKKNTQQLGGIFDALPTEVSGNIHCLSNPREAVIGFVSAGTITTKRIFIDYVEDLLPWNREPPIADCETFAVPPQKEKIDYYFQKYGMLYTPLDSLFTPFGIFTGISGAEIRCADCREKGGSNKKPSYWP